MSFEHATPSIFVIEDDVPLVKRAYRSPIHDREIIIICENKILANFNIMLILGLTPNPSEVRCQPPTEISIGGSIGGNEKDYLETLQKVNALAAYK
ncbi:MAG: hypothetical protein F6K62_11075 [Sphaerospermopsis sp. SIO1G2]|nr:hypothetical protein [Sphaerospermopsis sp. SIO1G2]